jgi:hypothetical protein
MAHALKKGRVLIAGDLLQRFIYEKYNLLVIVCYENWTQDISISAAARVEIIYMVSMQIEEFFGNGLSLFCLYRVRSVTSFSFCSTSPVSETKVSSTDFGDLCCLPALHGHSTMSEGGALAQLQDYISLTAIRGRSETQDTGRGDERHGR